MINLFAAEQLIIDRINAQVAGFVTVGNPSKLAGLRDIGPLLPACIVMPGGGEIGAEEQHGRRTLEDQVWDLVVIVAHQHTDAADGLTESIAGDFAAQCMNALIGWRPDMPGGRPMRYAGREDPAYGPGYAEFPLSFTLRAKVA